MIEEIKKEIQIIEDSDELVTLTKVYEILDKYNNQKNDESPYCEICGHCGEIGCCGIESFINNHIKGKTNCKNEALVIDDIIDLCRYETEVFKENKELEKYKNCWVELQNLHLKTKGELDKETINETDVIVYTQMMILEQKYNLGSDKDA